MARGVRRAPFAPSAGWGDVAVGLIALPLAAMAAAGSVRPIWIALWNALGTLDLITAVMLGVTSQPGTPFHPGLLDGRPGLWWTVNGRLYPDVPMFRVREGEVVRFRIVNDTSEGHPMHLHGHHVVVLSRGTTRATGSPWWTDSLEVAAGESYDVALVADNPGIWMDHCHNLPHATEGLLAHLVYDGVSTPFLVRGPHANHPE